MTTDTNPRERKARNHLKKLGLRLNKTPARHWTRAHYPVGYMILRGNQVVHGCFQREYEMTLEQVEKEIEERIQWRARSVAIRQLQEVRDEFFENGGTKDDWQHELKEITNGYVSEAA